MKTFRVASDSSCLIGLAIEKGLPIDKKMVVDQLINFGFRIGDKLYKKMFPDAN